jgi:hypothetical protein
VVATSNTNPERLVMLPRHLIFVIKPVQNLMIMASKRFTMTLVNKRKLRVLMDEEPEGVTTKVIATKTINLTKRSLASRVAEAAVATVEITKRQMLTSTLIMVRSNSSMTSSIKVAIEKRPAKDAEMPLINELMSNTQAKISTMMKDISRSLLVGGKITLIVKVENTKLTKVNNTTMTRVPRSLREKGSLPKHLREVRDPRPEVNMLLALMIKRLLMLLWVPRLCKSSKNFSSRPPRHRQEVARRNHRTYLPTSNIIIESLFQYFEKKSDPLEHHVHTTFCNEYM